MPQPNEQPDLVVQQLTEIKSLLQSLLIIEGARGGLTRDQVRILTSVSTQRVSDIWTNLKNKDDKNIDDK
jgi:hypothetical protein